MFPCFGVSKSQALKRLGGEPGDVLEERRLKVVRLNDEVTAFQDTKKKREENTL